MNFFPVGKRKYCKEGVEYQEGAAEVSAAACSRAVAAAMRVHCVEHGGNYASWTLDILDNIRVLLKYHYFKNRITMTYINSIFNVRYREDMYLRTPNPFPPPPFHVDTCKFKRSFHRHLSRNMKVSLRCMIKQRDR